MVADSFTDEDSWRPKNIMAWVKSTADLLEAIGNEELAEKINTTNEDMLNEIKVMIFDIARQNKDIMSNHDALQCVLSSLDM